jgi:hypothetical protein
MQKYKRVDRSCLRHTVLSMPVEGWVGAGVFNQQDPRFDPKAVPN